MNVLLADDGNKFKLNTSGSHVQGRLYRWDIGRVWIKLKVGVSSDEYNKRREFAGKLSVYTKKKVKYGSQNLICVKRSKDIKCSGHYK